VVLREIQEDADLQGREGPGSRAAEGRQGQAVEAVRQVVAAPRDREALAEPQVDAVPQAEEAEHRRVVATLLVEAVVEEVQRQLQFHRFPAEAEVEAEPRCLQFPASIQV
jgi:hypothetical protein